MGRVNLLFRKVPKLYVLIGEFATLGNTSIQISLAFVLSMCGLLIMRTGISSHLDSGDPHFRHLLCVGDAQGSNRGSERFEGDRYLRL